MTYSKVDARRHNNNERNAFRLAVPPVFWGSCPFSIFRDFLFNLLWGFHSITSVTTEQIACFLLLSFYLVCSLRSHVLFS